MGQRAVRFLLVCSGTCVVLYRLQGSLELLLVPPKAAFAAFSTSVARYKDVNGSNH